MMPEETRLGLEKNAESRLHQHSLTMPKSPFSRALAREAFDEASRRRAMPRAVIAAHHCFKSRRRISMRKQRQHADGHR